MHSGIKIQEYCENREIRDILKIRVTFEFGEIGDSD